MKCSTEENTNVDATVQNSVARYTYTPDSISHVFVNRVSYVLSSKILRSSQTVAIVRVFL